MDSWSLHPSSCSASRGGKTEKSLSWIWVSVVLGFHSTGSAFSWKGHSYFLKAKSFIGFDFCVVIYIFFFFSFSLLLMFVVWNEKKKKCDSVVILFQLIMGFNLLTVGIAGWKLFVKKTRAI